MTIPAINGSLLGISATSARDVWAVGFTNIQDQQQLTVIVHWNGAKWRVVKDPNPRIIEGARFSAVAASSPKDAWAAGADFGFPALTER